VISAAVSSICDLCWIDEFGTDVLSFHFTSICGANKEVQHKQPAFSDTVKLLHASWSIQETECLPQGG
jgi:hypothetical protein